MNKIIAAVRSDYAFNEALKSNVDVIFDLNPDILKLDKRIQDIHKVGKKIFVHLDLASGIGRDKSGILYLKQSGVDGIISTRVNIIKTAREVGMPTVQRLFVLDSQSLESSVESVNTSKPDIIEVMPGIAYKALKILKEKTSIPIIAGGLIESMEEANEALKNGAVSVSVGNTRLW